MQIENVIDELRRTHSLLNRAERAVADVILSDIESVTEMTIRELATMASVSEPTVVRLSRRLGCTGFPQLKRRLSQDYAVAQMFLRPDLVGKPRDAQSVGAQVYEAASQALNHAFLTHDPAALENAAEMIDNASQLYCLGAGGNSTNMALEAENRLFRFGVPVQTLIDPYRQFMSAVDSNSSTVFLIMSMTGRPQTLLDAADAAKLRGAKTICLTRSNSPLAALADALLVLDTPHQEADFQLPNRSRYAMLFMVDMLATLVGARRIKEAVPRLSRMRTALVSLHGPTDEQPIGD
ncbi:MurR/RpiR family transcriptional regulator [Paraburkholderia aspalathi]|nr:MurR/RpiR family transcriptional regulator [Paraburkholderia aspalathi]